MNKLRQALALLLSVVLFLGLMTSTSAQQASEEIQVYYVPLKIKIHGENMRPPDGQEGFIYLGSTYVPLRFVAYSLDKAVLWDQETYTVTIQEPSRQEKAIIQDYKLNRVVRTPEAASSEPVSPTTISVYFETVQYMFDGKQKWPEEDLPGMIFEDTLYVPIRFVSESLGLEVGWDQDTYTVTIGKKETPKKPVEPTEEPSEEQPEEAPKEQIDFPIPPNNSGGPGIPSYGGGGGGNNGGSGGTGGGGGGNNGGSGGTGGGATKPSYESIIGEAEAQISSLQSKAESELSAIINEFKQTRDSSLITEGQNKLNGFDNEFDQIMNSLSNELSRNGYDTSAVQEYREEYERIKSEKEQEVINDLLSSMRKGK
ncbi:copper amine oxidase N-terminal domain-containing protein [Paenibacillus sp. 32O-W]|uniref:copper amine oxidase N-terminal domain-containing protein n=1 Tax=Paenibacillus sp. 32O-W TaxID=1695218 RepID=UPI0011A854D3|nr:copper amine oxidase N-terminal domain-containing protein [Paenibacillus sp. 32O-W]